MKLADVQVVQGKLHGAIIQVMTCLHEVTNLVTKDEEDPEITECWMAARARYREGNAWVRDMFSALIRNTDEGREQLEKQMKEFKEKMEKSGNVKAGVVECKS